MNQENHNTHHPTSLAGKFEEYLGEFVYGGIDGCVTTFAVVAGSVGAGLDSSVIIILGFANLLADGFAMSIGAYLSAKSEMDNYVKHEKLQYAEIQNMPEAERADLREIYAQKGFDGDLLDQIVAKITEDEDRWVNVMMKEEHNMIKEDRNPRLIGLTTYISFLTIGLIPLLVYLIDYIRGIEGNLFFWSAVFTGIGFLSIGFLKAKVTQSGYLKSIAETLLLGAIAAFVAYYVGDFIESLIS